MKTDCVIENITLSNLYEAPLMLEKSNFSSVVCRELGIDAPESNLNEWKAMVERIKARTHHVDIGLVGEICQSSRCLSFGSRGASSRRILS